MIGGVDVIFAMQIEPAEALDPCTRLVTRRWPSAVVENAITGELYAEVAAIPFGQVSELMVYRDQAAFESWQSLGADPLQRQHDGTPARVWTWTGDGRRG